MLEEDEKPSLRSIMSFKNITLIERLLLFIMMVTVMIIAVVAFMFILRGR
jgi:cell division protein FtsL